ncbi:n-acetyltransferase-related [Holotrichia oblita]|uniref:N-acetyltransferase-related n=1 Tax=Holotrichia oblita TaxID=644536 RepID=A0ACB9T9V0_HOLOL|nr:n-acetyltransferase-related [Holotrichia oblita]
MTTIKQNLRYEFIHPKEKPQIIEFLKRNFYADEPLTEYIKVLDNPKSVKVLNEFSTKSIIENMSLLARTESGEIAGISLNSVKCKNDPKDEPVTDFLFGKIAKLLGFAYEDSKVFEKFPDIDCVISVDIISVDRKFQGQGIAKVLMDKTRQVIN